MSLGYVFRGAARRDVDAAYAFYEHRQPKLGDDFLGELNQFLALVCGNPHM